MNILNLIFVATSYARIVQYSPWSKKTSVNSKIKTFIKIFGCTSIIYYIIQYSYIIKIYFHSGNMEKKTFAQFYKASNLPTGDYEAYDW